MTGSRGFDGLAVVEEAFGLSRVEACTEYTIDGKHPPGRCAKIWPPNAVASGPGDVKPKVARKKAAAKKPTAPPAPAPEPESARPAVKKATVPARKAAARKTAAAAAPDPAQQAAPVASTAPTTPKTADQAAAEKHVQALVSKLIPQLRKVVSDELMNQAAIAPKAVLSLKAIGFGVRPAGRPVTEGGAQYYPENRSIDLNPGWRTNKAGWDKAMGDSLKDGYLTPTGSTILGAIVAHEFGHHVAMRSYKPPGLDIGLRAGKGERILKTVASSIGVPPPKGTGRGFWSWDELKAWTKANQGKLRNATSEYGAGSFHEVLAEAWQEYSTRGAQARPFARIVGKTLRNLAEGA